MMSGKDKNVNSTQGRDKKNGISINTATAKNEYKPQLKRSRSQPSLASELIARLKADEYSPAKSDTTEVRYSPESKMSATPRLTPTSTSNNQKPSLALTPANLKRLNDQSCLTMRDGDTFSNSSPKKDEDIEHQQNLEGFLQGVVKRMQQQREHDVLNKKTKPLDSQLKTADRRSAAQMVHEGAEALYGIDQPADVPLIVIDHAQGKLSGFIYNVIKLAKKISGLEPNRVIHPYKTSQLDENGIVKENIFLKHLDCQGGAVHLEGAYAFLPICLYGKPLSGKTLEKKLDGYKNKGFKKVIIFFGKTDYVDLEPAKAESLAADNLKNWLTQNSFLANEKYKSFLEIHSRVKTQEISNFSQLNYPLKFPDHEHIADKQFQLADLNKEILNYLGNHEINKDWMSASYGFIKRQNETNFGGRRSVRINTVEEEKMPNPKNQNSTQKINALIQQVKTPPMKLLGGSQAIELLDEKQLNISPPGRINLQREVEDTRKYAIKVAKKSEPAEAEALGAFYAGFLGNLPHHSPQSRSRSGSKSSNHSPTSAFSDNESPNSQKTIRVKS